MKRGAWKTALLLLAAWHLPAAAAPGDAGKQRSNDPNKKICRVSTETGSRLARKSVCRTAAEWDEAKKEQREFVRGLRNPTSNCTLPDPSHC